jgi:hypothetical protein
MTAEDFIRKDYNVKSDKLHVEWLLVEFAKIKVQEALQAAAESAIIKVQKKSQYGKYRKWQNVKEDEEFSLFDYEMKSSVDKDSILNAYNINEIK